MNQIDKQAQILQELIESKETSEKDLPYLVKCGLDQKVVSYWYEHHNNRRKGKMSTDQLLDKLTKAVSYQYRNDKTAPGIVVSALKKGYYCSVVRYSDAFAKGKKTVVCNARGDDLGFVLKELASKFIEKNVVQRDPVQELDAMLGNKKAVWPV